VHCKHRRGGFSHIIFVISGQFWIHTCRRKGRSMRAPAPIKHERPRGWPKKTWKWVFLIPSVSFDGFVKFAQYVSAETYAYAAVSPEVSRAGRASTESSAYNGRTGETHKD
jgi:hypothetical protein